MRDPFEQLCRIQEAIAKITSYVQKGRSKFEREEAIRLSIIYYLQTISGAANALPEDFRNDHTEISWKGLSDFQRFITHYYVEIDRDALWRIAEHDLPTVKALIEANFDLDERVTEHNISIEAHGSSESEAAVNKLLRAKREEILRIANRHGAFNVRVFGSVAKGKADSKSDIDFLVDTEPGRTLFDLSELLLDLQELLERDVDIVTEQELHSRIHERVLKEAMQL